MFSSLIDYQKAALQLGKIAEVIIPKLYFHLILQINFC